MRYADLTIGVVGMGGDGVVMLGSFLQRIAALQGYFSQMPRYYGAQIRGGGSAVKLSLGAGRSSLPKDELDLLLCFNWEKYLEFEAELALGPDTVVIYEDIAPTEMRLPERCFRVDFSGTSDKTSGSSRNKNIVALGLLDRVLSLGQRGLKEAIAENPDFEPLKKNQSAFQAGEQLFSDMAFPSLSLAPPQDSPAKVVLHGNAAVARGAIRAGCRAFLGYPITPASEIMQAMQEELSRRNGVFLQAEDEIASAGLALGASLAGAMPMTATSGPGLDLMTEMMGLFSAIELPMVIVDVQRCGPSTGIPSKSEQSDLNHAIYGGHGDAPRVVMAPYDVEGCYRLTIEATNIARYYQTLVILLSDQYLGQGLVAMNGSFLTEDYPIEDRKVASTTTDADYRRYRLTEDLISPMAVVGDEGLEYQTTGLTHDEKGTPSFDFEVHQAVHEKRWKKLGPLCHRDGLVKVFGREECTRGIVTWGSTAQFVLETVREMGLENEVKVCVPELIYPLPTRVKSFVGSVERLLVVEMNYSGQLYHHLRSQVDLPARTELYARAGGRLFSRKELARPIAEVAK